MAQSGYTPIQLYRTTTVSAAPTAGNLADGELAINTTDEKLYFKNAGGTVKLLASSASASADVTGPASATANALVAFDGTTGKLIKQAATVTVAQGGTGVASATAYALLTGGTTSTGAFQTVSGLGSSGQVLTSNGAGALPSWQSSSGVTTGKSIAMAMIFGL